MASSSQYTSFDESPTLGPMTTALHNITTRNLHEISTAYPDEKQFLRTWRRQLNDCMQLHSANLIHFLLSSTDLTEAPLIKRCNDILSKYSKPTWNFASSVRDLSMNLCMDDTLTGVEGELGMSSSELCKKMKVAIRMYTDSVTALCLAEGRLEEKLKRIETIMARINDLMFLDPNSALEQLGEPVQNYLSAILEKISLEEDYNEIMAQYKKFVTLRSIVLLGNFQKSAVPTCTICMGKDVSMVVTPCGHTYCEECCRAQVTACFICRVQIRDRVKLYFS
jgi:hypothetical protein